MEGRPAVAEAESRKWGRNGRGRGLKEGGGGGQRREAEGGGGGVATREGGPAAAASEGGRGIVAGERGVGPRKAGRGTVGFVGAGTRIAAAGAVAAAAVGCWWLLGAAVGRRPWRRRRCNRAAADPLRAVDCQKREKQ